MRPLADAIYGFVFYAVPVASAVSASLLTRITLYRTRREVA